MKRFFNLVLVFTLLQFSFFIIPFGIVYGKDNSNWQKDKAFLKKIMQDEKVLKKDPNNPRLNYEMGMNYFLMEEYKSAKSYFKKTLRLKPQDDNLRYRLGLKFAQASQIKDALNFFKEALDLDQNNSLVHIEMGQLYFKMRKYNKARKHYKLAAELDPLYEEDYRDIEKQIRQKMVIEKYQRILRKNPQDALTHGKLADIYRTLGREKEAIFHYQEAVRVDPNYKNFVPADIEIIN